MQQPPKFLGKLTNGVMSSWKTSGSLSCGVTEGRNKFLITYSPATREIYGGKEDGQILYPGFSFNVGRFIRVFDTPPKVHFNSVQNAAVHLMCIGIIEGTKVKVAIISKPIPGQGIYERLYIAGPKKGTIENIQNPNE